MISSEGILLFLKNSLSNDSFNNRIAFLLSLFNTIFSILSLSGIFVIPRLDFISFIYFFSFSNTFII